MEEQLKIDFDKIIKNLKPSKRDIELREKNLNKFIKNGFPKQTNRRLEIFRSKSNNFIKYKRIKIF